MVTFAILLRHIHFSRGSPKLFKSHPHINLKNKQIENSTNKTKQPRRLQQWDFRSVRERFLTKRASLVSFELPVPTTLTSSLDFPVSTSPCLLLAHRTAAVSKDSRGLGCRSYFSNSSQTTLLWKVIQWAFALMPTCRIPRNMVLVQFQI